MNAAISCTTGDWYVVRDVPSWEMSDLRMEISDTDRQDYRDMLDMLKEKKEALRKLLFAVRTS